MDFWESSFDDGSDLCSAKINSRHSDNAQRLRPFRTFSQTFEKFIFNEGNKMINVSGMKISLRKSPFRLCLCRVHLKGKRLNKEKKKDIRGYKFIFAYTITHKNRSKELWRLALGKMEQRHREQLKCSSTPMDDGEWRFIRVLSKHELVQSWLEPFLKPLP